MLAADFVNKINLFIIFYFLFVNISYFIFVIASIPIISHIYREETHSYKNHLFKFLNQLPITALLPIYNEGPEVYNTVMGLLKHDYSHLKITLINDGSTDDTLEILKEKFQLYPIQITAAQHLKTATIKAYYATDLYPQLIVIDKEHSGKADALNAGLNICFTSLFFSFDADSFLEPHTIYNLMLSMLSKPNTIAVGGSVYVVNNCKIKQGKIAKYQSSFQPFVLLQVAEYLRAFFFGRTAWNMFKGPLVLSGALTLFDKETVLQIGGFQRDTVGEDMEIIVNLHKYMRKNKLPYRIEHNVFPSVWTKVPETIEGIWNQRSRWQQGLLESLLRHADMFFNPRYGATGLIVYPFYFLAELIGPIVELVGYVALIISYFLGILNWTIAILFFLICWVLSTIITMSTVLLHQITLNKYRNWQETLWILFIVAIENFGYRQILVICRSAVLLSVIFKKLFKRKGATKQYGWNKAI